MTLRPLLHTYKNVEDYVTTSSLKDVTF